MENELDIELYDKYINGDSKAFESLYNKYKDKIKYFIYNIIKDYQKSEDIMQEVFMYVLQNKFKEECSFKSYLYIIARSRSINYLKYEKNKSEINENLIQYEEDIVENDTEDIVINNELKDELIKSINSLDDKYKNAIYLVEIEEFSYKETAEILGESIQNVKTLIHRGKKELKKKMIKKGLVEMNSTKKALIIIVCISVLASSITYAAIQSYNNSKKENKVRMTPTFTSQISTTDSNKVWVGTFNLVWNDFMDYIGGEVKFDDGESALANELNKQLFTENQLSEDSYFKMHGKVSYELKETIENGIKEKFNEESAILDKTDWDDSNGYVLYAMLKKEFNFLEPFSTASAGISFNGSEEKYQCFSMSASDGFIAKKNVEILFFNSEEDFAIKLLTKEGEEVYLYKTTGEGKSFEENYQEMTENSKNYSGSSEFGEEDVLKVPFLTVHEEINYDELCGRYVNGGDWYIKQAMQTIDFELNNVGGSVKSEAMLAATQRSIGTISRNMIFDSDFIVFLKEENKEKPYFALKVDNNDVLVPYEEPIYNY